MGVVGFFQIYELRVMETKPDKAVSIIECDMNVRSQTTLEYSVSVSTENSTCFSGGFRCSFGLQRTWAATSAPRGTHCKDRALTHNCVLRTSWFSESLYRKEKITAVTLTWTWASGWVAVHLLHGCQPRAAKNWWKLHLDSLIQAFTGSGNRLDGKTKGIEPSPAPLGPSDIKRWAEVQQCRNERF